MQGFPYWGNKRIPDAYMICINKKIQNKWVRLLVKKVYAVLGCNSTWQ